MSDRDCENCKHHTEKGCDSWDCEFEQGMTREEKVNLLNELLEIEEKNDIGNLTRAERGEFQQWVNDTIEQESCDKCVYSTKDGYCQYDDITEAIPPFETCEDTIMTLDEAIKHAEEVAEQNEWFEKNHLENKGCKECAEEHRQLAEWLKDYKRLKEQEPKTGHWIAQDIHNCHTDFKCSECGYIHSFMHLYGEPTADYSYCPNCGAKMEEEE